MAENIYVEMLEKANAENARLRALVEDAIDTLEAMDLHTDNPLYNRLRAGVDEQIAAKEER